MQTDLRGRELHGHLGRVKAVEQVPDIVDDGLQGRRLRLEGPLDGDLGRVGRALGVVVIPQGMGVQVVAGVLLSLEATVQKLHAPCKSAGTSWTFRPCLHGSSIQVCVCKALQCPAAARSLGQAPSQRSCRGRGACPLSHAAQCATVTLAAQTAVGP